MKQKFTFLMAALMLLTMISQPTRFWGQTYKKVTSAPTGTATWDGEYLLVYESGSTAYVWTGVDVASCYATTTISSGVITKPNDAQSLTIASMTGGYSIKVNGGTNNNKYIYGTKNSNTINFGNSATANTLTYSSGVDIESNTSHLVYNSAKGNLRFRYYKSTTYSSSGYYKPQLYRKAYTVTYNNNGGSGNMTDSNSPYFENSTVTTKTNSFTRDGYSFNGWNTASDGSGTGYAEGATFTISANTTLYAQWASATTVNTPSIYLDGGTYTGNQSTTISCGTDGASIYYTLDGTNPSSSNGTLYSGAITIDHSCTLKAIGIKDGLTASEIASATYTIKVNTPSFTSTGGNLFQTTSVSITCETVGASIYYTTDGTDPTSGSTLYSSAITVSSAQTIKAIAIKSGLTNSDVATAIYAFPTVISVAEARAYANTTDFFYTRGVVTYVGDGKTAYIQDATAAIAIYKNDNSFTSGLSVGDEIVVYGKKTTYHGLVEVGTATIVTTLSTSNTVSPTVKTVAAINTDYGSGSGNNVFQSMFVKIEKATYNGSNSVTQSGSSITVEGTMTGASNGDAVTFTGIIGCYDGVKIINLGNVEIVNDPFVSVSPSTALPFSYIVGNGPSAAQTFTVTGTYLTDDDIIVSVPSDSDFEIKTGAGEYTNSLTLASGDSFYVRMKSGKTNDEATYSTTLTIENDGADEVNIALSGSVSYLNVTYNGNADGVTNVPTDAANYTYNASVTVLGEGSMARTGYDFVKWNTESDGTGDEYEEGDTFNITEDVTLYAQWDAATWTLTAASVAHGSISFTVGGVASSTSAKTGETVTIVPTPDSGYGMSSFSINGGSAQTGTTFTMPASNVTVSATFVPTVTDVLTASLINQSSYGNWSGKYHAGEAVYAGNSTTGGSNSSSIQLRDNTNSGIVTTTSGGTARKVSVTWNSSTAAGRTLQVYGKNQAYSGTTGASDLYDNDKKGTLLGTIVYGTSTELTINGDYEYIGMRSSNNAMYLDEIDITWAAPTHTLSYDKNDSGASGTMSDPNSPYIYNTSVTVLAKANTITAPSGKMFARWDTNAEGNGTSYAPGDIFSMPKNDMTLYAIWVDECTTTATMNAATATKEYVNTAGTPSFNINLSSSVYALSACSAITEYGFVYSTSVTTPTVGGDNCTKIVKGNANPTINVAFTDVIEDASLNTTYYVRSYATNLAGTAYSSVVSVPTGSAYNHYTISYKTNGEDEESTTIIYQGNAISDLIEPTPANVPAGYTFRGWFNGDYALSNSAPTFVKNGDAISANLTLKAVFAIGTTGEGEFTKSYGWEDADDASVWTITDAITKTSGQGYNSSSYAGRINSNHTYVTFKDKVKVKEFSFAFKRTSNNDNYNVYIETSLLGDSWEAIETYAMSSFDKNGTYAVKTHTFDGTTAKYVRFHCYNTTAERYVDDVTITYDAEYTTYSNYCTSVSPQTAISGIEDGHIKKVGTIASGTAVYLNTPLIIDKDATLTVNGSLGCDNPANLIIEDGGQLIVHNDNVQATIKKTVTASAKTATNWYTIASPVRNVNIGAVGDAGSVNNLKEEHGYYDLYRFNETKNDSGEGDYRWENYKNDDYDDFTSLVTGRGYLYRREGTATLEYVGEVNGSESEEYILTRDGAAPLTGFHLIGNPYSHDIYKGKGAAIDDTKLNEGFYRLTNGTAWTPALGWENPIHSGEGILVQANATGTLTIYNSTTAASGESKYNDDNIMFSVSNSQHKDVAYAVFDKGHGLNKIEHRDDNIPMLYISQNGEDYAIAMMSDDTKTFGLSLKATTMGQYTLKMKANGNYTYLHVIDRLTGEDVDMLLEDEYTFVASANDIRERFIVKLGYMPDYSDAENDVIAYQSGDQILVSGEGELQIFDIIGRKVMTTAINGVEAISGLQQGVYIFRVIGETQKTQKIVVR